MSVPAKRLAKRHKRNRASHHALDQLALTTCENCHKPTLPHHACSFCGHYRGKKVMEVMSPQLKNFKKQEKAAAKSQKKVPAKADKGQTSPAHAAAMPTAPQSGSVSAPAAAAGHRQNKQTVKKAPV